MRRLLQQRVVLKSPKHSQLALFLLEHFELGTASPFAHYLATLPSRFARFPLHYPPALLDQLRGTCILDQILARRQDIARDYEAIVGCVGEAGRFGAGRFLEARLLVSSRVFGIVVEGAKTDALVPVADMLNHHLPKQTSWYYCDRRKGFVIQSLREIEAGAEVLSDVVTRGLPAHLVNGEAMPPAVDLEGDLSALLHRGLVRRQVMELVRAGVGRPADGSGLQTGRRSQRTDGQHAEVDGGIGGRRHAVIIVRLRGGECRREECRAQRREYEQTIGLHTNLRG